MSGAHSKKEYFVIFVLLTILTGIEVAIAKSTTGNTKIVGLIGLAVSKAALVALFYMHLKSETRSLKTIIAVPLAFPFIYALVLIAEAAARGIYTFGGI
jgi:cytochrome c oxidase subunit 4